ncbi:MAG: GAF domain-containing protein, partial [Chloroflexota bacterium]
AELDTSAVLQKIVDLARQVASARYAALGIFDENGEVTQFLTSGISAEERARIGALPRGRGLLGLLQEEQRPIRVADLGRHPASVGFPPDHPPMRSFLGVPILWRGRSVGNLYLTEKIEAEEFSADDEEALMTLAAQAAIAIENARLYEQLGRIAVLEERHRIGMDLHDGAMQSLYGVGLLLEDVSDRLEGEPEVARSELARAVDRLNATIADLRGYVLGLK